MAESKVISGRSNSSSPPPNCAICLGSCTNKCFSDSCMHEFCFRCLLEWSKIKAECPLCKQPFKSIIHNVKSNEEYDEHVVETTRNEEIHLIDNEEFLFLPPFQPTHRHEFHVRTTFTVDSRGEHAIQQMLLAHPRITIGTSYPTSRSLHPTRHRPRDYSATSFRRSIYAQNLWVNVLPDLSGRYRDVSPAFFRDNPAARQRLVPWLNRELNALLYENTQLIMHLVDLIMEHLLRHHICSRTFRCLLRDYLDTKTDHFIHEFYSFMRTPFDMIGYDRNVIYTSRPQSPAPFLEDDTVEVPDNSDDSDVIIIGASNPAEPVTIDLLNSDSDSDEPIMISPASQVPMPMMPQGSRDETPAQPPSRPTVINLPPKLRHKHKALQEKEKWRWVKKRYRRRSRSSSSNSSSSPDKREKESYRRYKRRKILKKMLKAKRRNTPSASDTEVNVTSETDDDVPLDVIKRKWKNRERTDQKRKKVKIESDSTMVGGSSRCQTNSEQSPDTEPVHLPSCSRFPSPYTKPSPPPTYSSDSSSKTASNTPDHHQNRPYNDSDIAQRHEVSSTHNHCSSETASSSSSSSTDDCNRAGESSKSEVKVKLENEGPSNWKPLILRRNQNKWYFLGESDSTD